MKRMGRIYLRHASGKSLLVATNLDKRKVDTDSDSLNYRQLSGS